MPESDMCYECDRCGEDTEDPVSIHAPIGGGGRTILDFCPECAQEVMQGMVDRLGHEHGSKLVMEVKTKSAMRKSRADRAVEEDDTEED